MSTDLQFSKENLLIMLDQLKQLIKDDTLTKDAQEEIWNSLIWNKHNPENKELMKYMVTGWWVHYNLN